MGEAEGHESPQRNGELDTEASQPCLEELPLVARINRRQDAKVNKQKYENEDVQSGNFSTVDIQLDTANPPSSSSPPPSSPAPLPHRSSSLTETAARSKVPSPPQQKNMENKKDCTTPDQSDNSDEE